jgi:DNA polymerase III alpha subunit (gram-positive type)
MGNFYFDIETTGLNPKKDKIISIQFQELERNTGKAIGELKILKEWETSERKILQKFIEETKIDDPYPFAFVPVGYNLNFEHNFLKERTALHSMTPIDILNKPFIDLRAIGVIMNQGEFKGSGLDKITGKPSSGKQVPIWYQNKQFELITEYIKTEAREFIKLNEWLHCELPAFLEKFKKENILP